MKDFCLVATSLWNSTISRWRTPLPIKILLYDLDEGLLVPLLLLKGELLALGISPKLQLNLVQPHVNLGQKGKFWNNIFENICFTSYLAIRRSDQGRHSHVLRFKYMKSEEIHCVRLWNVRDTDFRVYIIIEIKYFEGNFTCRFFIFAVFFITCLLASLFRLWEHQGLVLEKVSAEKGIMTELLNQFSNCKHDKER